MRRGPRPAGALLGPWSDAPGRTPRPRGPLHHSQQLHHIAKPIGELDIGGPYAGDPLTEHIVAGDVVAESDPGQDGRLGRRIVSLDVGRRIALCQPQRLGFGQHRVVVRSILSHLGEDVVGGAVHNAGDPVDAFAGQRFPEGPDQRYSPGDGSLIEKVDRPFPGQGPKGDPVGRCQEGLVGGDHRLPCFESRADQSAGRLQASHELDDDVDRRVGDQGLRVVGEKVDRDVSIHGPRQVGDSDAAEFQVNPALDGDGIRASL